MTPVAALDAFGSSFPSNHWLKASFNSSSIFNSTNSSINISSFSLIFLTATAIPYPYSALSSNKEFAQAGPLPSLFTQYGVDGALAPQIDEQPVALASIILSPNS